MVAESGAARQTTNQLKILDSDFLSWNTRMINVRLCSRSKYYSLDIWSTITWTESQRFSQQMVNADADVFFYEWCWQLLWKLRNVFLPWSLVSPPRGHRTLAWFHSSVIGIPPPSVRGGRGEVRADSDYSWPGLKISFLFLLAKINGFFYVLYRGMPDFRFITSKYK